MVTFNLRLADLWCKTARMGNSTITEVETILTAPQYFEHSFQSSSGRIFYMPVTVYHNY